MSRAPLSLGSNQKAPRTKNAPLDEPPQLFPRRETEISDADAVDEINAFVASTAAGAGPREEVVASLKQIAAAVAEDAFHG